MNTQAQFFGAFLEALARHDALTKPSPRIRVARLCRFDDGRCFATNHHGPHALNHANKWDWIQRMVAEEFGCRPDDVLLIENDEGEELYTIDGKSVAFMTGE